MYLVYENEIGRVSMCGSGRKTPWRITAVTGLELPSKSFNTATYAWQNGQETLSEVVNARAITIGGDVKNDSQLQFELTRAVRIFNKPGALKLYLGDKQRKINCRVTAFELDDRNGAVQPFVLQLTADDPNFEDLHSTSTAVFNRINKITGSFTLPMVFTERTTEATIVNIGDVKTEPIFYIKNLGGGTGTRTASDKGIKLENSTTGQIIWLNYSTVGGETLTVDLKNRKITSDKPKSGNNYGNLIMFISNNTFLNAFWLEIGLNKIKAANLNNGEVITVLCEFTNKYIEAVR